MKEQATTVIKSAGSGVEDAEAEVKVDLSVDASKPSAKRKTGRPKKRGRPKKKKPEAIEEDEQQAKSRSDGEKKSEDTVKVEEDDSSNQTKESATTPGRSIGAYSVLMSIKDMPRIPKKQKRKRNSPIATKRTASIDVSDEKSANIDGSKPQDGKKVAESEVAQPAQKKRRGCPLGGWPNRKKKKQPTSTASNVVVPSDLSNSISQNHAIIATNGASNGENQNQVSEMIESKVIVPVKMVKVKNDSASIQEAPSRIETTAFAPEKGEWV